MKRLLVMAMLSLGCGGGSVSEFQTLVSGAKTCDETAGERCVLAGAATCLCATAVNARNEAQVNEAAAGVNCGGQLATCTGNYNARCVNNLCVAN